MPSVSVPIGIDIPNPFLPFILPPIHIHIAHVAVPANVLSGVVLTLVFDSVGVGPLLRALDDTAAGLRVSRAALNTVRDAIANDSAARMRAALDGSGPQGPLAVEILEPQPAAAVATFGTIAVRLRGANWAFVDPAGEGLPAEAISRIRIMVNGSDVPLSSVGWASRNTYLDARITYSTRAADDTGVLVAPGPVTVTVLVADGADATSAARTWHFIVSAPAEVVIRELRWFPILVRRPFPPAART